MVERSYKEGLEEAIPDSILNCVLKNKPKMIALGRKGFIPDLMSFSQLVLTVCQSFVGKTPSLHQGVTGKGHQSVIGQKTWIGGSRGAQPKYGSGG